MEKEFESERLFVNALGKSVPGLCEALEKGLDYQVTQFEDLEIEMSEQVDAEAVKGVDFSNATLAACHRLGFGHFRANLHPYNANFSRKAKSAWGITIDSYGITAVKIEKKA